MAVVALEGAVAPMSCFVDDSAGEETSRVLCSECQSLSHLNRSPYRYLLRVVGM